MWSWFKKLFGNKMSPEQLQGIKDSLSKYQKFQWIKSERMGIVTELKDVVFDGGIIYVEFADGSRINFGLMDEFVLKIENDVELLDLQEPNNRALNQPMANVGNAVVRSSGNTVASKESPIQALLKKQKSNPVDIDIAIQLNIPAPELYTVLCGSFENADEEIVNFIVASVDVETIKTSVREALKKYYS